jgi:hypothetical protein
MTTSPPFMSRWTRKCGALDVSQPQELPRPFAGKALPFYRIFVTSNCTVRLHRLKQSSVSVKPEGIRPQHNAVKFPASVMSCLMILHSISCVPCSLVAREANVSRVMGSDEPMNVSPAHAPAPLGVSKAGVAIATFLIVHAIRGNEDYSALRSIWVTASLSHCVPVTGHPADVTQRSQYWNGTGKAKY